MSDRDFLFQLQETIEGLRWPSEADYPFIVVDWPEVEAVTVASIRDRLNLAEDTPVIVQDADSFFQAVTADKAWYNEAEKAEMQRYRALVKLLSAKLTHLNVFRLGNLEIDILILGQRPNGGVVGLRTAAVET
jgi:hypothetical protein